MTTKFLRMTEGGGRLCGFGTTFFSVSSSSFSSSSSSSSSSPSPFSSPPLGELPSLQTWHSTVSEIPLSSLLPVGLGGTTLANVGAFYGDKILGHRVALSQASHFERERESSPHSPHREVREVTLELLTNCQSDAVSNALFSSLLPKILPHHATPEIVTAVSRQVHDAGTMVEAAVHAVSQLPGSRLPGSPAPELAIDCLADWLVAVSHERMSASSPGTLNFKGRLIEMGGTVTSARVLGTPDDAPRFAAVAVVEGRRGRGEGMSKRESEQRAARAALGNDDNKKKGKKKREGD